MGEMDIACSTHGRDGKCIVGKPGERDLEDPCENNIKIDHKGLEWEGVNWINLLQDRDQ